MTFLRTFWILLSWITAVNASSIFKHQLFTCGANQSFLKTNYQHLHAAICVFSDFCLDNWFFYSGFKSACTTVNGLLSLWSHCCVATCQSAQSDRWQSLVPEVVSCVNWLSTVLSSYSPLVAQNCLHLPKIARTRSITIICTFFVLVFLCKFL